MIKVRFMIFRHSVISKVTVSITKITVNSDCFLNVNNFFVTQLTGLITLLIGSVGLVCSFSIPRCKIPLFILRVDVTPVVSLNF